MGRAALEEFAGKPLTKRFAGFMIADPEVVLAGRETILRDGETVGYLTSGGYGYTIGKNIGYGYVRNSEGVTDEFLNSGKYELVVANEPHSAELCLGALYDPQNLKVKA